MGAGVRLENSLPSPTRPYNPDSSHANGTTCVSNPHKHNETPVSPTGSVYQLSSNRDPDQRSNTDERVARREVSSITLRLAELAQTRTNEAEVTS